MIFKIFVKTLTKFEKYLLYKKEDRIAQLIAIKNFFYKPKLVSPYNLYYINFLQKYIFVNYLFEKLELINKKEYFNYLNIFNNISISINKVYNYIINDYKLYNIIWPNIIDLNYNLKINDSKYFLNINLNKNNSNLLNINSDFINSLLLDFELYLKPLEVMVEENKEIIQNDNNQNDNNDLKKKNKKKTSSHKYMQFKKYVPKKEMIYLKYLNNLVKDNYNNLKNLKMTNLYDFILEELLIHTNIMKNPYTLININEYIIFLKTLNYSDNEILFYIDLCKIHNFNIKKILNLVKDEDYFYTEIKTDVLKFRINNLLKLNLFQIRKLEEKKILSQLGFYIEFNFKTVIEFIEMFIFKFEGFFKINLDILLENFYKGIENQIFFFEFYNLLVLEFMTLKLIFDLYTIKFITEFLEFLNLLSSLIGINSTIFEKSIFNISNSPFFKDLKLFRFNFWSRFILFKINNYNLYYNFFFYNNVKLSINNYFMLFNNTNKINLSTEDLKLCNREDLFNILNVLDINNEIKTFSLVFSQIENRIYFNKFFIYNYIYRRMFTRVKKLKLQLFYFKHIMNYLLFYLNSDGFNFLKFIDNSQYTLSFLKFINIYKFKDFLLYRYLIQLYLSRKNKDYLINNINLLKEGINKISNEIRVKRLFFFKSCLIVNKIKLIDELDSLYFWNLNNWDIILKYLRNSVIIKEKKKNE